MVAELAGVDPAHVRVDATPEALVVHGERRRPAAHGRVYQQMGIEYGPFHVAVPLPRDADTANAKATYEHGLLTIVLPLARRHVGPVEVPIQVEAP